MHADLAHPTRSAPRKAPRWRRWYLTGLTGLAAYSTGLGWQAQAVSYPLYRSVTPDNFAAYHLDYNGAIPLPVIVPGFATFLAAVAFWWTRPAEVTRRKAAIVSGVGLVALGTTVAWAIPMHNRLDRIGQSAATIDSLLRANLVRSLALTAATIVLLHELARDARPGPVPEPEAGDAPLARSESYR
ncbi:MAG: hypothetical protein AB7W59_17235 [Acidimicrobiia bacterium]